MLRKKQQPPLYYLKVLVLLSIALTSTFGSTSNAEMRILTTEEPPTNYTINGELHGTSVDIVRAIKKQLGIAVPIELMAWARAYEISKRQPNIIIFTAGRSPERVKHGFHFVGPIMTRSHSLWSLADKKLVIGKLDDIKNQGLTMGALRGDWREKYFADRGFRVQSATTHDMTLRMLLVDRFDLMVSSDIEAPSIAKEMGINPNKISPAYDFQTASSYIMISKGTSMEIVNEWKAAFEELQKTDFFEKRSEYWSARLGFKLSYSKELGYYVDNKSSTH